VTLSRANVLLCVYALRCVAMPCHVRLNSRIRRSTPPTAVT
jgi:hypothetical protein